MVRSKNGFNKIFDMGPLYIKLLINNSKNPFWISTLQSYIIFFSMKSNDPDGLLSAPMWYNPLLSPDLQYIHDWYVHGI